jgi:site-specific recombinase XerD
MSAIDDHHLIDRFVHHLPLRHRQSAAVYRCILRQFQRFVVGRSAREPVSRDSIRLWLEGRRREWPLHLVYHRARLVDRFLTWLVAARVIRMNPFAEWRRQYGQRTTTPIVRALLSPNVEAALEALRPLPRFGGPFGELLHTHVARMQALGFRYEVQAGRLVRFDRFLQQHPDLAGQPLPMLIRAWSDEGSSVHHTWEAQSCGRIISTAMHRLDSTTTILPVDRQLSRQLCLQHRRPYICTTEDIRRILDTARTFPSPLAPLRPVSLYTMVVLAVCAGLRLGELARLTLGDVHLDDGTVEIRETKFFKSRRLPLAPSVVAALRVYLHARRQAGAPMQPAAGLFWHQQRRGWYSRVMIEKLLVRVFRRAGLKPARGKAGLRVHDLRHSSGTPIIPASDVKVCHFRGIA